MAKTTTITREYDHEGRVVKETIVESSEMDYPPVAISDPNVYPTVTTSPPYIYKPPAGGIRPSSDWPTYKVYD